MIRIWLMGMLFTFGKGGIKAPAINAAIRGESKEQGITSGVKRARKLPPTNTCNQRRQVGVTLKKIKIKPTLY